MQSSLNMDEYDQQVRNSIPFSKFKFSFCCFGSLHGEFL
jgi:hypothetical protein